MLCLHFKDSFIGLSVASAAAERRNWVRYLGRANWYRIFLLGNFRFSLEFGIVRGGYQNFPGILYCGDALYVIFKKILTILTSGKCIIFVRL